MLGIKIRRKKKNMFLAL